LSSTVGRQVSVHLPSGQTLNGLALGLDPHGRLEVQGADGVIVTVGAGDVVHVR
jgi:BirA family biotin operon repressor/biotin-[acetyl-CoA-carboxylase] ligase